MEEFDLFDQCMYLIGVSEYGSGAAPPATSSAAAARRAGPRSRWTCAASAPPQYDFLAFPGEEPPSIECNEDAGEEFIDG